MSEELCQSCKLPIVRERPKLASEVSMCRRCNAALFDLLFAFSRKDTPENRREAETRKVTDDWV